ncbi:MAG: BNR-4 repeat-containing protein, partial [Bacteroidota bacterium]
ENYRGLTYPRFFENMEGDLLVVLREGGHTNGKYQFAKFDGATWTDWTDFNVLNARSQGMPHNWGLYGDMKYLHGKLRIGFHTRLSDNEDAYRLNNGFHYAYSNDPSGITQWYNYADEAIPIPLIDYREIKFSEPANEVSSSGVNSITINRGADWTVTANEDIHFITEVIKDGDRTPVHTYKKAENQSFTTTTDFPSGSLYSIGDEIFLLNLENRRPVIYKAQGGTNEWKEIYRATSGKQFRHGNAIVEDGKLCYYLMEMGSGSAQPIWLQVYDLGIVSSTTSAPPIAMPLKAYPNPNEHGSFQLSKVVEWQVVSSTGALLLKGKGDAVDLSAFPKGVYFLRIDSAKGTALEKIVLD